MKNHRRINILEQLKQQSDSAVLLSIESSRVKPPKLRTHYPARHNVSRMNTKKYLSSALFEKRHGQLYDIIWG
jgi:hypothetical protein